MEEEIWKDIPGYDGLYQASTLGRIKSLNYKGRHIEAIIVPTISANSAHPNYMTAKVSLANNGKRITKNVHRLILCTFAPANDKNLNVDHIDGNPLNNRLDNLRWATQMENVHNPNTFNKTIDAAKRNVKIAQKYCNTKEAIQKKTETLKDRYKVIPHHRIGCKHTKETKEKISISNKGRGLIPVLQYSLSGDFIREWEGIIEAAKFVGVQSSHISRCCKGYQKNSAGYIWRYKK